MSKVFLVLSDGTVFEGEGFGACRDATGELVFTTGMNGYIETLTDPSYYGQIVVQTFPMIGNYGVIEEDFEGECRIRGYVVREWCDAPSNFRCQYDVDRFLAARGIPGIAGIDTRALTRRLRENGTVNARICTEIPADLTPVRTYAVRGALAAVSYGKSKVYPAEGEEKFRVTLIDYGAKRNIVRCLTRRGCTVTAVPYNTGADEILAAHPDGLMLSNGPGDPAENTEQIRTLAALAGKLPVFGICLGHQLFALANGAETEKLKYGHRGANQPVRDCTGCRTYITSQNHGYAVLPEKLQNGFVRYVNANDGSCEGIDYPALRAFTVQFHPEACSGPEDTEFLFDRFVSMMGGEY